MTWSRTLRLPSRSIGPRGSDNDKDGIGDNADLDDDNDMVPDTEDAFDDQ